MTKRRMVLPQLGAHRLREIRFAAAYVRHNGNGSAAIREAGFVGKRADDAACHLLSKPRVRALVAREYRKLADIADVKEAQITRELAAVAFSDVRQIFNDDGSVRDVKDLDPFTARAISSIEIDEIFAGEGEDRKVIGHTRKIKFWPKTQALEVLCKKLGLLKPLEVKHDVSDSLAELIRQSMQPQQEPTRTVTDGRVIEHEPR